MKKIRVFDYVTIDGYFAGSHGETDWFKSGEKNDDLYEYTHAQSKSTGTLIFGRKTYEMMRGYWPTPEAIKHDPEMARVLNNSQKIVFSRKLKGVKESENWRNIQLLREINPKEIENLKRKSGGALTILGSGTIVQQFAELGLIDEYNLVVVPVILGAGKSFFKAVGKINLKLVQCRAFKSGIVLLKYKKEGK